MFQGVINHGICWRLCRSEPYDPYLPRDGPSSGAGQGNAKTAAIQAQINDTVGIMKTNLDKVMERGELVDSLHDKTGVCWMLLSFFSVCVCVVFFDTDLCWGIYCRRTKLTWPDNLAVSAQGFRRGANRVRKVSFSDIEDSSDQFFLLFYRICGKHDDYFSWTWMELMELIWFVVQGGRIWRYVCIQIVTNQLLTARFRCASSLASQ